VGKSRLPQWALQATRANTGAGPGALSTPAAAPANARRKPAVPVRQVAAKVDSTWQQQQQAPLPQQQPGSRAAAATNAAAARRGGGGGGATPPPATPQYQGPDGDLWANLARDVLDQSLNVKFADIAGLAEAKRVLLEAITLPMMMPEYFTGIRRPVKARPGAAAARAEAGRPASSACAPTTLTHPPATRRAS
jgi:katanin p60 ATPase-containing subunit A1